MIRIDSQTIRTDLEHSNEDDHDEPVRRAANKSIKPRLAVIGHAARLLHPPLVSITALPNGHGE